MKDILKNINKVFENKIRMGIMSVLSVNESVDFNRMKEVLAVTDGNLASNIKSLEKNGYIDVSKEFVGKKPHTTYRITKLGKSAFIKHIDAVERFIKAQK
ncbi:MAG: transcriptional regulator [Bacteroidota bacterium]